MRIFSSTETVASIEEKRIPPPPRPLPMFSFSLNHSTLLSFVKRKKIRAKTFTKFYFRIVRVFFFSTITIDVIEIYKTSIEFGDPCRYTYIARFREGELKETRK